METGDMISVDKYSGKVSHINTRYTVLQGLDGVETVLPNEMGDHFGVGLGAEMVALFD